MDDHDNTKGGENVESMKPSNPLVMHQPYSFSVVREIRATTNVVERCLHVDSKEHGALAPGLEAGSRRCKGYR